MRAQNAGEPMERFFKHNLEELKHPYLHYDRRGRPSAKLEQNMVEAASRPLVDAVLQILRRGVQPTLTETEYVFFSYNIRADNGVIREKYLDVTLVHDGPDRGDAGPIAQVSMIKPGAMRWLRDYKDEFVYASIAERPEEFRVAFESAIRFIFGHLEVLP